MRKPRPRFCLLCHRPAKARGLCKTHHVRARRAITCGRTSWPALEAQGKALPAGRVGRMGGIHAPPHMSLTDADWLAHLDALGERVKREEALFP